MVSDPRPSPSLDEAEMYVPQAHRPVLEKAGTLGKSEIEEMLSRLDSVAPNRAAILRSVPSPNGLSRDEVDTLIGSLVGIRRTLMSHSWTVHGAAASVAHSDDLDLDEEQRERLLVLLVEGMQNEAVRTIASAVEAYAAYPLTFHAVQFFTDLRPFYGQGEDEVTGGAVIHILSLEVLGDSGAETIQVALDDADLETLSKRLTEAQHRGVALRNLTNRLKLPLVEPEDLYG